MDCETTRLLLSLRRPSGESELGAEDLATLERHLAGCERCAELARRQSNFDQAVSQAVHDLEVPAELFGKLQADLQQASRRQWRRQILRRSLVAAGVLAAVGTFYGAYQINRPVLDVEEVAIQLDRGIQNPEQVVTDWLGRQGLPGEIPGNLDLRHHVFHGTETILGKETPVVILQAYQPRLGGIGTLRLYIIRGNDFKPGEIEDNRGSFYTARVIEDDRANSGYLYLALFTTPTIEPFLRPNIPPI